MITCTRKLEFDAGHRVPLHESKCKTPHGHRYVVEITCEADYLSAEGFVVDFGVVKRVVGAWIDEYMDHTMILQRGDDLGEQIAGAMLSAGCREAYWMDEAPTAENLAKLLFRRAAQLLATERGLHVVGVVVWETPNCKAEYRL